MAEGWNFASIEPLNDENYFLWKEKIEGILRAKKLWKKVIEKEEPEKPQEDEQNYEQKFKIWDEWDDGNHAARAIMINTMSPAQVLKYCKEKKAGRLWNQIKHNMAEESEPIKVKALSELTNMRMTKDESVDAYINRAEALTNKCAQLGKIIEEYELKMYVMRGLRSEFDQNVRILENQREVTINEIRYALKQEEERNERRKGERIHREQEGIRRVKEKVSNEIHCFNCGKKGHISSECYGKAKCFNCQGYGHKSNECRETRNSRPTRGRGQRGRFQRRGHQDRYGYGRGRGEAMMSTSEENVMTVSDRTYVNKTVGSEKDRRDVNVKNLEWLLDSGSTSHMINDIKVFNKLEHDMREITLADKEGRKLISSGIGDVVMKQEQIKNRVRLTNVLCVPDLNANLLSVAKFTDFGYIVKFSKLGAEIYKEPDNVQMIAVRRGNGYYVESNTINREEVTLTTDNDIWHQRLGHVNRNIIEEMKKENLAIGMKEQNKINVQCESCVEGKICRKVHARLKNRRAKEILELWHIDLIGPINPISKGGKRYIFTIVDDYSRMIFVILLREKSEAAEELKRLIILKENQSNKRIKAIRSDSGGEFIGDNLNTWLKNKGIKHELSPARTPQCNGVAERANRTLIEMTRALMSDSHLPMFFWAEAVCVSAHTRNRVKSMVHEKTPYELWNGRKPNIGYMKRFGCIAFVLNKQHSKGKFEPKTCKGIFLGYAENNTYRVYIPETGKVRNDNDVKFDESRNGVELLDGKKETENKKKEELSIVGLDIETTYEETEPNEENIDEIAQDEDSIYLDAGEEGINEQSERQDEDGREEDAIEVEEEEVRSRSRGRPRGATREVIEVQRHLQQEEEKQRAEAEGLRRSERIRDRNYAMMIVGEEIPKTVNQAKESENWEKWRQAMNEEMKSMRKHQVWNVVPRPQGRKVISSKWVYSIKEDPTTKERRYKARLVALGCVQRPGYDYGETFAPVVRIETVRLLFSIGAEMKKKIHMYDVKTAFLHGKLTEEIFMEMPKSYEENNNVCRLNKSIYGLKQAGRCWNQFLVEVVIKNGLEQSREDPCLFYRKEGEHFLYCAIHVDDIIVVSSSDKFEKNYMEKIGREIELKSLGEAKSVLGLQVEQMEGKIAVHLNDYIEKLLEAYGMRECNAVTSPIDVNVKMENNEKSPTCNIERYQELMGRLMYLSVYARPDISFALSCLSQFNKNPKVMHMMALKRILRYLKGTTHYRLVFGDKDCIKGIECESDASWDSTEDAKSYSGMLMYRNGDLIHWRSRKQKMVALSSTESELECVLECVKELIWCDRILNEIDCKKIIKKVIKCDNLNVVKLANGGNFKTKSKLLNRKCWYVREAVINEKLEIIHVPSVVMTADCMTKPLSGPNLLRNVKKILVTEKQ